MKTSTCLLLAAVCLFCLVQSSVAEDPIGLPVAPLPPFPCVPYDYRADAPRPTNVNELHPHDVEVVMSMGDSITAAFGATGANLLDFADSPLIPREDRYLSYANGAGSMQYTLFNFLKLYQYKIAGGSYGQTLPIDALSFHGHHLEPKLKQYIGLNAALSGAKVQDMADEVDYLVEELTGHYADDGLDFENSWKVLTILIGANNLCVACHNNTADLPETYGNLLNDTIAQIHDSIPRVRVNILPIFNVTQVYDWSRASEYCRNIWKVFDECPCLGGDSDHEDRMTVNDYAVQYRQITDEVVDYWQTIESDTFSVTSQPATGNFHIINGELTSNFDCFHPSQLAHAYLGSVLWNSMMLPPDQKPTNMTDVMLNGIDFVCPDKDTYLQ